MLRHTEHVYYFGNFNWTFMRQVMPSTGEPDPLNIRIGRNAQLLFSEIVPSHTAKDFIDRDVCLLKVDIGIEIFD